MSRWGRYNILAFYCILAFSLLADQTNPLFAQQPVSSLAQQNSVVSHVANDGSGYFTLFVYPASRPLNYQSPASVLWSILGIEAKRLLGSRGKISFVDARGDTRSISVPYQSSIGHTIAHIACKLPDSTTYDQWVSLSSHQYTKTSLRMLLKEKSGLAFLFHEFTDGFLITDEENVLRLVHYQGARTKDFGQQNARNQPRYLAFQVEALECSAMKDMVEFFDQLQQHNFLDKDAEINDLKAEDKLIFTSVLDPYDSYQKRITSGVGKVGGGCAPFGVALIKVAGYHHPILDTLWMRPFHVSEKLLGNDGKQVPVTPMLFGKLGRNWKYPNFPLRSVNIYDPDWMWQFIGNLQDKLHIGSPVDATVVEWLEVSGLSLQKGDEVSLSLDIPSLTYHPYLLYRVIGKKEPTSIYIHGVRINRESNPVSPGNRD